MPVASPVRSRPAYTWYRKLGSLWEAVAMRSQPSRAGMLTAMRVRLRPSHSKSAPVVKHPMGVAIAARDAAEQTEVVSSRKWHTDCGQWRAA
jgi:hypothetical protein